MQRFRGENEGLKAAVHWLIVIAYEGGVDAGGLAVPAMCDIVY